ncbi:hypothetical protein KR044_004003, partial [Drosophila immigrans]
DGEGDTVPPTAEGEPEDCAEMDTGATALSDQEWRRKRREEKKRAREILDRHYRLSHPESTTTEAETQLKSSQGEEAEEECDDEGEGGNVESMAVEEAQELQRLESSLLAEEDLRTGVSSSEDEGDYVRRKQSISFKADFLQYFYLPSMSDLTTDSEEEQITEQLSRLGTKVEEDLNLDKGKFVDPLTGESIPSKEEEEDQEEEPMPKEIVEDESSSSSEFEWPFEDDDEDLKPPPIISDVDDLVLEMFLDARTSLGKSRDESFTQLEAAKAIRETRQIAFEFIHKIIDQVVEISEYVDPIKLLRGNLDKDKLMAQLQKLYSQFLVAKQYNVDVNNKMYEYYRRVGQVRSFDTLPPKVEQVEYKRYMDALMMLDHLKNKAAETKKTNSEVLTSVRLDMDYVHTIALASVDSLEQCFRDVLLRKDAQYLPRVVENELRRMQQVRNEVSDSRLFLITRQHTLGRLVERKRKFDQITDDLTMDQYLMAQRDVTALGTKVEERNHDLNRMRDRCTKHMHQLAFIREKTSLSLATLAHKTNQLNEKFGRREELRDQLLKLKLKRSSLQNQKAELYEKCGILYKPALLHDFDATVDFIEAKRETVSKLKSTMLDLETRIATLE